MTNHIHDMKEGDTLSFKGPIPKYPWSPNKHDHITLISGGTGITPMYQLIRAIFKNPEDKTKVSLIFGNVGGRRHPTQRRTLAAGEGVPTAAQVFLHAGQPARVMEVRQRLHHQRVAEGTHSGPEEREYQGLRVWAPGPVQGHQWHEALPAGSG